MKEAQKFLEELPKAHKWVIFKAVYTGRLSLHVTEVNGDIKTYLGPDPLDVDTGTYTEFLYAIRGLVDNPAIGDLGEYVEASQWP